jgi:WD40 repeat protein
MQNEYLIASGSNDGSAKVFDIRSDKKELFFIKNLNNKGILI